MKNDLISREALKKAIAEKYTKVFEDYEQGYNDGLNEVIDLIDNAPTINTTCPNCDSGYAQGYSDGYLKGKEERPHGKWITNMTTGDIFCSFCKEVRRDTRIRHINFCNSCGAKMDKKEADNDIQGT